MQRYKVLKAYVDYGIYHEVGDIITDVSIISNLEVKLWEGTLVLIDEKGNMIPFEKITHTPPVKQVIATTKSEPVKPVAKVVTKVTTK